MIPKHLDPLPYYDIITSYLSGYDACCLNYVNTEFKEICNNIDVINTKTKEIDPLELVNQFKKNNFEPLNVIFITHPICSNRYPNPKEISKYDDRMLNSDMQIISRASQESATTKLYRAGATQVVSPFKAGAAKMQQFMVNPKASELVDWFSAGGVDFELSEFKIENNSRYLNRALKDVDLIQNGIIAVASRHAGDQYNVPPDPNEVLKEGDTLLILGRMEVINDFLGISV